MINELFGKCKYILVESINKLKGSDKRKALAQTAKQVGKGGQSIVASEFNVSRDTIRKGTYELDSLDVVYKFTKNMTWKSKQPSVRVTKNSYETGVTVEKDIMNLYETALYRAKEIGKWFVIIEPIKCKEVLYMEIKV